MEVYQTEEQQVEAIKGYWKENGNTIIAGLAIGFAGFIGFNLYQENQLEQELAVSDSYQVLIEKNVKGDETFVEEAKQFIADNAQSSYASLAALALAKDAASHQDWKLAQQQLTQAIESSPSEGVKAIASLRLARVQVQLAQYTEALVTLAKPLPESFTSAIEEIKGDVYLQQGNQDLARTAYQAAIAAGGLTTSPALQIKLDDLAQVVNVPAATLTTSPLTEKSAQ